MSLIRAPLIVPHLGIRRGRREVQKSFGDPLSLCPVSDSRGKFEPLLASRGSPKRWLPSIRQSRQEPARSASSHVPRHPGRATRRSRSSRAGDRGAQRTSRSEPLCRRFAHPTRAGWTRRLGPASARRDLDLLVLGRHPFGARDRTPNGLASRVAVAARADDEESNKRRQAARRRAELLWAIPAYNVGPWIRLAWKPAAPLPSQAQKKATHTPSRQQRRHTVFSQPLRRTARKGAAGR